MRKTRSDKGRTHKNGWKWTLEQKAKIRGKSKSELHRFKISRAMQGLSPDVTNDDLLKAKLDALRGDIRKFRERRVC